VLFLPGILDVAPKPWSSASTTVPGCGSVERVPARVGAVLEPGRLESALASAFAKLMPSTSQFVL
jgi:hypothetical protein